MSTDQPKSKRRLRWLLASLVVLAPVAYIWRGHIGCMAYPECNPLLSVAKVPDWNVPTSPVERVGYDFAHALKLPTGVPQPVPFDFKAARTKAIEAKLSAFEIHQDMAQQYFDHLCRTEAGAQIFQRATNVDGFRFLRTPYHLIDKPEDHDRYGTETAFLISAGGSSEIDHWVGGWPEYLVQPVNGQYLYLEQPEVERTDAVVRFSRMLNPNPPHGYQNGLSSNRKIDGVWRHFELPLMIVPEREVAPKAEYGITWRGIRRERDREFAIAGGETIVIELATSKVLAIDREFVLSGRDHRPSHIWWANAKNCGAGRRSESLVYLPTLAERVLAPKLDVNAPFINSSTSESQDSP